ncbi:MAG: hypothetical protein R6U89_12205 [Dehalococcoidia bacterium]
MAESNGKMTLLTSGQFWIALILLVITAVISVGNYQRWWDWYFDLGYFSFTHWLVLFGAGYIAASTPVYLYLKRYRKTNFRILLKVHVFGNLIAFSLISIHFTQQAGRPSQFAPVHSTGLILYIFAGAMVMTGFLQRFGLFSRLRKPWRFIHTSLILSFYIVLIIHILQFYGITWE